jgi:hypothetical protein
MKINNLKKAYAACIAVLTLFAILTPILISNGFFTIGEELLEALTIAILITMGFIITKLYEKELTSKESYLQEAWGHIGEINLLTEAFKDALVDIEKYPENKQEMKHLLVIMTDKILGMINSPFVMIRILLPDKGNKILSECIRPRENSPKFKIKISDNDIISGKNEAYEIISSTAKNSKIKSFCVFPKTKITNEQRLFIQKITNDITMLFIIFNSEFYKK